MAKPFVIVLVILLVADFAACAAPNTISTGYDKFKDQTTVSTPLVNQRAKPGGDPWLIRVSAAYSYPGQSLTSPPDGATITVVTWSKNGLCFDGQKDSLVANIDCDRDRSTAAIQSYDGKLSQGLVSRAGAQGMETVEDDNYIETLTFQIPAEVFAKMAYSSQAGMEIGDCQIEFNVDLLDFMKQLAVLGRFGRRIPSLSSAAALPTTMPTSQPSTANGPVLAAYRQAMEKCIEKLSNTDEYKSAKAAVDQATQARNSASDEDIPAAAQKLLEARTRLHQLERDACDADPDVQKAKSSISQAPQN